MGFLVLREVARFMFALFIDFLKMEGVRLATCGGDAQGSKRPLEVVTDIFRLRLRFSLID